MPYRLDFKGDIEVEDTITAIRHSMSLVENSFEIKEIKEDYKLPKSVSTKLREITSNFEIND